MVDNSQSWQQQFSSYAEYANWYHNYYEQTTATSATTAVPSHTALPHPDAAVSATAAIAPPTHYYPGYVAPPPHPQAPYSHPPTAIPPPVAGTGIIFPSDEKFILIQYDYVDVALIIFLYL